MGGWAGPYSRPLERLVAVVVTHRSAGLDVIGSLDGLVEPAYRLLYPLVDGVVVLYTCNRFEVYVDVEPSQRERVSARLRELLGSAWVYARVLVGREAARHLYRVAAGLDSAMLGEHEVLGQVRDAWKWAREHAYTTRLLDMLFHGALVAGRRARRETGVSRGAVGYPEAAVELASERLGGLDGRRVLVVGAGKAAKAMLAFLCSKYKPRLVVIANRSPEKAEALAVEAVQHYNCAIEPRGLDSSLEGFDAALVAVSGSPELSWLPGAASLVVDISLPPAAPRASNVLRIDDVNRFSRRNLEKRLEEARKAEAIVEEEVERLERLLREKSVEPLVSEIMQAAKRLAEVSALEAWRAISARGSDGVLERAFWSYAKQLLHPLLVSLRRLAREGHVDALRVLEEEYSKLASRTR